LRIAINAIGEPGDDSEHAEPAELTGEVADLLVVVQNSPLSEKNGPVTFVAIDERESGGTCIGHVGTDVEEIFEEPEEGKGQAIGLALKKEVGGTEKRRNEFTQSAAEDHDGVAKGAEERMASFVDGQVGEVEEEKAGGVAPSVEEKEKIERQANAAPDAGDAGPLLGAVERKFHEKSVTVEESGAGGIEGGVALVTIVLNWR